MPKISELLGEYEIKNMQANMKWDIARNVDLPTEVLAMIELEYKGGYCLKCHKEWKRQDVKNKLADFYYFLPDCDCFPVCMHCARSYREMNLPEKMASLHRVAILGSVTKCPACKKHPFKEDEPIAEKKHEDKWYTTT
jgi:hypothetical protein